MSLSDTGGMLFVFQNALPQQEEAYNEWYSDLHLPDEMRIPCAIAVQRFKADYDVLGSLNDSHVPVQRYHTIYEWADVAKAIEEHFDRGCTDLMPITKSGDFGSSFYEKFFQLKYLSEAYDPAVGIWRGTAMSSAMILPNGRDIAAFADWFQTVHAPLVAAIEGVETVALCIGHPTQMFPGELKFPAIAVYGLSDPERAARNWRACALTSSDYMLDEHAEDFRWGFWRSVTQRVTPARYSPPQPDDLAAEQRIRETHAGTFFDRDEFVSQLVAL